MSRIMEKNLIWMIFIICVLLSISYLIFDVKKKSNENGRYFCKGSSRCLEGDIEDIVDGDTLLVDEEIVRLSLVNAPEKGDIGYDEAIEFIEDKCPIGSKVIVDEDDLQISRSHRRTLGLVYCFSSEGRAINLNYELLRTGNARIIESFCDSSEFSEEEWVTSYGCSS